MKRSDNLEGQTDAGARLRSFIQRIERLEEDKKSVAEDIKDVYAEAKSSGFDVKVIRAIVRQFERAGTAALEAKDLWRTPEIRALKGLQALKQGGSPDELIRKTKETIFVA